MAVAANTFVTYSAKGLREDLTDIITNIDPVTNVVLTRVPNVTATGTYHEWQSETLETPTSIPAIEGDEYSNETPNPTTRLGNYCGIERKVAAVTETLEAVSKAGRTSEMAREKAKKSKELSNRMEYAIVIPTAVAASGASGTARSIKAMRGWITTNTATAVYSTFTGATASDALNTQLQKIYDAGGNPQTVICGSAMKIKLSTMTANNTRWTQADDKSVTNAVDVYKSDFGDVKIIPHRIMSSGAASTVIAMSDNSLWAVAYLRRPKWTDLAKTGSNTRAACEVEFTLEARAEKGSARIETT